MAEPQSAQRVRPRTRFPKWLAYVLGSFLTIAVGALLTLSGQGLFTRLSYDLTFSLQKKIPEELIMVYLDSQVKINLEQPADRPIDRRFHARLLDKLKQDGAKLVVYDLLFDTPSADPEADRQLAHAMHEQGHVVLVADYAREVQGIAFTDSAVPPIPLLQAAAAGWGIGRVALDSSDFSVRKIDPGSESNPSLSWVAASLLGASVAGNPSNRLQPRWLNYYCAPHELRAINFDHAVQDGGLDKGFFRDKIVVVGARPEVIEVGGRDQFGNPYYRFGSPTSPGAAVHAYSLLNLLRGDWLRRLSLGQELLIALLWGCGLSALLMWLTPWRAIAVAALSAGTFVGVIAYLQLHYHFWFAWAVPAFGQTSFALVWAVGYRYLIESGRRRKLRRAFAVYASPYMADQIADSDFDPAPGGKLAEATIMFTDLEGFTSMSEGLDPNELSRILISYFSLTTRAIFEQDGIVIKFVGDAVMAAWGAPVPDPNHAERAVVAAWGMHQAGQREIEGRKFRTRFGINTGHVLAGNLGSDVRFDFTLIGDATNVAQRLEGLNKFLRTDILISEETRSRLSQRVQVRALGQFVVAGRVNPIEVHEVLGVAGAPSGEGLSEWVKVFSQGRQHFVSGDFVRATGLFKEVIQLRNGQDGPSSFFLEEIARMNSREVGAAWDGVIRLESK